MGKDDKCIKPLTKCKTYLPTTSTTQVKMKKFMAMGQWNIQEDKGQDEERDEEEDNWRERGLEKMMGGMLEIKKEDELKKVWGS